MPTAPIEKLEDFVSEILGRTAPNSRLISYRGHGNSAFKLQPSIFRTAVNRENEHILLRELVAAHPEDFSTDTSALELLVRMQHYSLPTRVLDVSLNPLVALYFACEPAKKRVPAVSAGKRVLRSTEADGEVVILSIPKRRLRYFDSDTVAILANLARLPWDLQKKIDTDLDQEEFNKSLPIRRLLHFIRQESSGFEPEIVSGDLNYVLMVKPKQNNKRILAQSGAFFIFGLTEELEDPNTLGVKIDRISIAADAKKPIRDQLDKFAINEKTLFPEIERAARYIAGTLTTPVSASKLI
jgi:hypothetical protein